MNGLVHYDEMKQAIAQANNLDDVLSIRDKAEALRNYAKQIGESLEQQNLIAEIKIRAERRAGEMTRQIPKRAGRRKINFGHHVQNLLTKGQTLEVAGVSPKQANRWEDEAVIDDEIFERYIAETKAEGHEELTSTGLIEIGKTKKRADREAKRDQRRQVNADKAATTPDLLAAGVQFPTILIDPPWDWGDEGDINQMGRAKPDYATMSLDQLLAMPVSKLSDKDAHLYLWITNRSLPKGFALLDAWGFRYVTCLTWVKPHFGMGNYFRGQTEHILFGVKGSQPLLRRDVGTVFHAERGPNRHSSKPPMIYDLIESCSPGPYLELFSRVNRSDWSAWGADAG